MIKTIEDWTNDTKKIGILSKRAEYATNYLSTEESTEAILKWKEGLQNFANEYSISTDTARLISIVISDSVIPNFK